MREYFSFFLEISQRMEIPSSQATWVDFFLVVPNHMCFLADKKNVPKIIEAAHATM